MITREIENYVDSKKNEIIDNFSQLVKIPSITRRAPNSSFPYGEDVAKALDFCKMLCENKGFFVKNYNYRCLKAIIDGETLGKEILIAAHVDVVDGDRRSKYPLFYGEIVDGYMIGRGSVDDKGPLIAAIYALNFFVEKKIPLHNRFSLFIGSNEENGMSDLEYYLEYEPQPTIGIAVDDDFPVVIGENSRIFYSVVAESNPNILAIRYKKDLRSPVPFEFYMNYRNHGMKFMKEAEKNPVIEIIKYLYNQDEGIFEDDKLNHFFEEVLLEKKGEIGEIIGSDNVKVTPRGMSIFQSGKMKFTFSVSCSPNIDVELLNKRIQSYCGNYNMDLYLDKIDKGYYHDSTHPVVDLLTKVTNNFLNKDYSPYVMKGCTYARKFDFGIGFGAGNPEEKKPFPDDFGCCHGPDEAQNINVLLDAIKVYIFAIKKLDEYYDEIK